MKNNDEMLDWVFECFAAADYLNVDSAFITELIEGC